jgi:hypothetical protein
MLNFSPEDWQRIERDTMAWWAGELQRPLVYLAAPDPAVPAPRGYMSNYPLEMPAEQVVDEYAAYLNGASFYSDAFPWVWVNFGPGIAAGFLGANVHSVSGEAETVWFTPLEKKAIGELTLAYDADNVWWKRVKALTAGLIERFNGQVAVSHTDLGGNLDILASIRETEGLLFDLYDHPEEVDRLVRQTIALWLRYYDELDAMIRPVCRGTSCWTPLWSTGTTYMLQCDFSYMISPAMFERFVLPDLEACCAHLTHGFYHLDGKGEIPHLDLLLGMKDLHGIQWIPGDGQPAPDKWLPLLKRIRDGGKLCQVFVDPEGARRIVRELGGKGFLFVINSWTEQQVQPETVSAFLKTLAEEDISLRSR